jgi:hypothetical protein
VCLIPRASGPAHLHVHRRKPVAGAALPLQPGGTRPELANKPRLQPFKEGLATIEAALADVDACAMTPDQKIQEYAAQCKALTQWAKVQHTQWPALAADADANQALHQTLDRLEAGAAALGELKQPAPAPQDDTQAPSSAGGAAPPPRDAAAEAAYKAGFKKASLLVEQKAAGVPVMTELVEVLHIAADAFSTCTAGQPACEHDHNELLKLRHALVGCRFDFSLLPRPQTKALLAALEMLGLRTVEKKATVRIMLPTLHE